MLLCWEQGTGKTVISIAAADKLLELKKAKRILVIGRPSDYFQWAEKLDEFSDSNHVLVTAKDKVSRRYGRSNRNGYWVTNWNLFRRDYDTISSRSWDIVIWDECQEFRNYLSKTSKLIKKFNVTNKPAYRWALTGTSISNKLEDLYNIMYCVDAKFLPPWPTFSKNHLMFGELGMVIGYKNLKSLHTLLEKRMDRKTHEDLKGQVPRLVQQVHKIAADPAYFKAETQLLSKLDDLAARIYFDKNGDPVIPQDKAVAKAFREVRNLLASDKKLKYAVQLAETLLGENENNRIVFFSHYKEPLYRLHSLFDAAGQYKTTYFTGDQELSEKRSNLEEYQRGTIRILLSSNAGKAGLDLKTTNYVIHIDVPPSHEIDDQRNKRHTRLGSTFDFVVAIYLVLEDSIEEFYYEVVKNKGKLALGAQEGKYDEVTIRPSSLRTHIRGEDEEDSPVSSVKNEVKDSRQKAKGPARRANRRSA